MNNEAFRITPVVSAIIEDDQQRILMVREANPEHFGRWNQPSGHVDPHESITDALLREVREETGYLHVRIDGLSRIYYFVDDGVLRMNFSASVLDSETGPLADDVLEARWFTRDEVEELIRQGQLRSRRTELAIRDWISGIRGDANLVQTVSGM
jgi:ADP-ribose pyrophosphatase YjhB (NUDIX family)